MTMDCNQHSDLFDDRLVEGVRQGSASAFSALVARHRDTVYRIARNLCATSSQAEEAIRHTFLAAYREFESLQSDESFRNWLCGLAMKAAQAEKKGANALPANTLEPLLPQFDQAGRLPPSPVEWPDLERAKVAGVLREALELIEDGVRAAFVLCDLAELSVDEAATILQVPPPVIRQRVHRARLLLRGFLQRLLLPT